ncbi:hypothetical protein EYC98_02245 [Halieaceae bacterium IMCC14734]|uniref:Uncharacterized protein n=1 Tax=Candidatus Litorirhabdus singularis TaxID=2518993 RepID=A0ABT3TBM7_9GAMM|nr:hypothetical protein [Candidatus Litorirhabdus singularis]MCX2979678.1 hypothetical protein [Candidatus Litorirhabdus singularis]
MKSYIIAGLLLLPLLTTAAIAAEKQPRWMSPEAGFIDPETDTRVEQVSPEQGDGSYQLTLSMPRVDKEIEEVLVIGQSPDKPGQPSPVKFDLTNDLDGGRSGIILYLGEKRDFAVHINYEDGSRLRLPATASNPGAALKIKP